MAGVAPVAYGSPTAVNSSQVDLIFEHDSQVNVTRLKSVAVDNEGYLYINQDFSVLKLDPQGNVIATLGGQDQFLRVELITVDAQGNVYVLDTVYDAGNPFPRLTKMDAAGSVIIRKQIGWWSHSKLMVNSSGEIYIICKDWRSIEKYDSELNYIGQVWSGDLQGAVISGDNLYVSDKHYLTYQQYNDGVIRVWNGQGYSIIKNGFMYEYYIPVMLTADNAGNFYAQRNGTLYRFNTQGIMEKVAEGLGTILDITSDNNGVVYAVDYINGLLYKVLPPLPTAAHSTVAASKSSVIANGIDSTIVTVTLKNEKGNAWSGRQVSLTSDSGYGSITPVNNGLTNYNGQASFVINSTVAETVTYTAWDITDNFNLQLTQTAAVTFRPGPASQLVWRSVPSGSGTAGEPFLMQPSFYLMDQHGNVLAEDNSSVVTLTASGGTPLTGNTVTVRAGVAEFTDLKTTKAGSFTVTASYGGISSSASNTITISPGPLAQLSWDCQPPVSGTQGQLLIQWQAQTPTLPVLYLNDQYGNMLTNDNSTRVMLMASGGQLLSGNLTTAVNGVVTFNVIPNNYGTFTLRGVAHGGIQSTESIPITVAPYVNPRLDSLRAGTIVNFAGHNWVVLDPAKGYLLMKDNIRTFAEGYNHPFTLAFDTNIANPMFNPASSTSIAYYLDNTFYNSLPAATRDYILMHSWTTGPNSGQASNQENSTSSLSRIGLISYSEFQQYKSIILDTAGGVGDWWWTRTPYTDYYVWSIYYDDILGNYCFDNSSVTVRPAIYVAPNLIVDGAILGFGVPELFVTTQDATGIGSSAAIGHGSIASSGIPNATAHGLCWSTSPNPTILDERVDLGVVLTTGVFSAGITGLSPHTTYYVRAYATNQIATVYGEQVSFKTLAILRVTADNKTVTYSDTVPELTYVITGFVDGDDLSVVTGTASLNTTYTQTTPVADSPVAIEINQGSLSAPANYAFQFVNGLITINSKALIATAIVQDKAYDGNLVATGTISLAGNVGTDEVTASGTFAFDSADAGQNKTVNVTGITLSGARAENYTVNENVGTTASITRRHLTVAADPGVKYLGDNDPILTWRITLGSLVEGDSITGTLARIPGEGLGRYQIHQGTLTASQNYAILFIPAEFVIVEYVEPDSPPAQSQPSESTDPPEHKNTSVVVSGEIITLEDGRVVESFIIPTTLADSILQEKVNYSTHVEITLGTIVAEDNVDQPMVEVSIPTEIIDALVGMSLTISTPHGALSLPPQLIDSLSAEGNPLKIMVDRHPAETVSDLMPAGTEPISQALRVQTDLRGPTKVTIMLDVPLPTDPDLRQTYLETLTTFAIHSDSTREMIYDMEHEIVERKWFDEQGTEVVSYELSLVSFWVNHFTRFIVVKPNWEVLTTTVNVRGFSIAGLYRDMVACYYSAGNAYMPIRMLEDFGVNFAWEEANRTVSMSYKGRIIVLTIGSTEAYINGVRTPIIGANGAALAPELTEGRTMIPLRFVSEYLGFKVTWDPSNTITIRFAAF